MMMMMMMMMMYITKTMSCYGTLSPNRKQMLLNFGQKMKLKQGDIMTSVKGNFTAIMCKNKQNVNTSRNTLSQPEGL